MRIIDDPWLPVSHSFRCFSAQDVLDDDERVSLLINDATRSWDKDIWFMSFLLPGKLR